MPLSQCRASSEHSLAMTSMTCTQTMPKSNWQILCKCSESTQSNGHNGTTTPPPTTTTSIECNGTNCINRTNGSNEFEHVNGVESGVLIETRYINSNQQLVVCVSFIIGEYKSIASDGMIRKH